jgi:hypothetical protein
MVDVVVSIFRPPNCFHRRLFVVLLPNIIQWRIRNFETPCGYPQFPSGSRPVVTIE